MDLYHFIFFAKSKFSIPFALNLHLISFVQLKFEFNSRVHVIDQSTFIWTELNIHKIYSFVSSFEQMNIIGSLQQHKAQICEEDTMPSNRVGTQIWFNFDWLVTLQFAHVITFNDLLTSHFLRFHVFGWRWGEITCTLLWVQ
jgi:hypothetical protein